MADDISTADMARLLLGMSATSPQGLTDPGMAVMSPLQRVVPKGQIPYDTAVSNGPTPMERFVGSLGEFKGKALDMMPVVGSARALAHGFHGYQQGDTAKAAAGALVGGLALPLELMAFARPGAALSTEEALRNFRSGAQMPEHASRIAARSMPHPPEPPRGGAHPSGNMSSRDIVYEMDVNGLNRRVSKRLGEGVQDMRAPADAYERALMEQQARAAMRPFNVISGGN